jgi:pSer/pThr/pTyr-binding forkhead associated (FHA) protein
MPQLMIHNREEEREIELGACTKIGRVLENDICLQDVNISRHHAEIICTDEGYLFKDLGSSNGSYIKDVRITERPLGNGDAVRIGEVTLTFIEDITDATPAGLVRIASNPISERAIQDRMEVGVESAFTPASLISDDMDWREDYEKLRG